jgi:glycosyltransferase involved in cell wall biosynthesis
MRIGFNAQILARANAGVATYAKNIIQHLVQRESDHEFYIFGNREFLPPLESRRTRLLSTNAMVKGSWRRILWEQFVLPIKSRRHQVEVMYYPDHTSALIEKTCPEIITIHDLAFLAYPETFATSNRLYKTLAVKRSAQQAERIIVVSQATKQECLRWLEVPETKLRVIHNGISNGFKQIEDKAKLEETQKKFGLNSNFILFVGTLEPRKNLVKLISAYADLRQQKRIEHQLIVVGAKGWLFSEIFASVEKLSLKKQVSFLGYVTEEELVALYNLADVLVYPSLYEGFGFPPLEAMACGCPVVTSKQSSLPEIAGEAARLVDSYDIADIADGIFDVLNDASLRQRLIERGLERVKLFTWARAAQQILQVIDELG